ncbi:MAG: tetraacyldisaccharide 4'-kinase [Candidatus Aureabacteria bacterium]|nr:tetraacyldisaccharide 4'-kinase [Candidatus Auribacterota bacterium]
MNTRYWNDLVEGRRRGITACCLLFLLWCLSLLYRLCAAVRSWAYDRHILKSSRLPLPVISVGNIVVGGAGKTPFVEFLASELKNRGTRVAILSRGYKGRNMETPPHLVSDGTRVLLSAGEAGDEPVMLAKKLTGVIVVTDPDRLRAGRQTVQRLGADLFVLDDGFQHRKLARDVDILLLDCCRPFGNGNLLPAGQLRETPRSIRRADIIVFTRCVSPPPQALVAEVRGFNSRAPVFTASIEPSGLTEIRTGVMRDPVFLKGKRIAAFSAIARPDDFGRKLARLEATVVYHRPFPDHHMFTGREIKDVIDAGFSAGAEAIVTTAKDAVRLPEGLSAAVPLFSLEIEMKIVEGADKLVESVLRILKEKKR